MNVSYEGIGQWAATFACDVKGIGTPAEFDYNPATQSAEPAKAVKG